MIKNFKVKKKEEAIRLDKWLKKNFSSLKQSFIEKNIRKKNILVNKLKKISSYKLIYEDEITILNFDQEKYKHFPPIKKSHIIPNKLQELFNSSIVYENNNFIILNKWTGIATQDGSKINISIDHIIKNISPYYNLVHRLDRETSGLLIIAKNLEYTKIFGHMFKYQEIEKKYLALCQGKPKNSESIVDLDIKDKKKDNLKHKTKTYYKVLNVKNNLSQILFVPKTGKTHQLRIVSKKLGCPIVGDAKYNIRQKFKNEKLKLNAHLLRFKIKRKIYEFSSILPIHFQDFIKKNHLPSITLRDIRL